MKVYLGFLMIYTNIDLDALKTCDEAYITKYFRVKIYLWTWTKGRSS